jgi:hypothetical protein
MLVTPYCKRTQPGRRTTQRPRVSPFACLLSFSPLRAPSRTDPSGLGHAATIYSSVQGPPGVETPTARLPCLRIMKVTFCTLSVIPSTKLGEFILGSLTLALIMLLCIRVRHLALGNQPMLNCLRRKLLLHQMSLTFHLKLLMHLMC